jgi:hypothetical protein
VGGGAYGGGVAGNFTVKVEDHSDLLHCFEYGVVDLVALDTGFRVCSDAARVGFDADDASSVGRADVVGGEVRVEVESHKESCVGVDALEGVEVRQGLCGRCYWWFQVGLQRN